ncbi:MAG TPA: PilZ domain-containing protein [Terriglobales bacterium]|nr:PilZ domain-containing protein [Terriglobales bacterium]
MCISGRSGKSKPEDPERGLESVSADNSKDVKTANNPGRKHYTDVQSAARFPVKLPIAVKSDAGVQPAESQNMSANGVLFEVDADMPVGSPVDFTISLPADVVGSVEDVRVDCRGRVVRSFEDGGRRGVGVVIDEYRFERR